MNKPTILLIDDEPEVLATLSCLLEDDYNVLSAANGKEGLSLASSNQLSLILLDLNMPEMTGIQFLQFFRNAGNNTPVMVITGNSSHDWAKRCADLNVQGYIEKPFDVERLLSRINMLVHVERSLYYAPNRKHEGSDRWDPTSYGKNFSDDGADA